jgi:acetylornithine deacetylase/succinyl-diaminopimelate desuccinylase-like protein
VQALVLRRSGDAPIAVRMIRRALQLSAVLVAAFFVSSISQAAESDLAALKATIAKQHDKSVQRLQDWIKLPAIAAENRGFPEGAEHMAKLLKEVGFQRAEIIPTKGKPGVFATLDAGAAKTVGIYFMYDVKQFDPKEWSSPPIEAAIVDRPNVGKAVVGRGAVNQKGP